jgi:predicted Zn-dependent protease
MRFLDEAQALNPLRGLPHLIRARILRENPALAGPDWLEKSLAAYRQALALDPLMYRARLAAAELLLNEGRRAEALQLLDEGAAYIYAETPELTSFYRLTARLRREAGRAGEAAVLEVKAMALEARFAPGYPAQQRLVP